MTSRPLEGIKILDFTRFQAGPHATLMLADLGAEVLKVEHPVGGDLGRRIGLQPDGFCGYFEASNRAKKSMTLNLKAPEARAIVTRLVQTYDVVVENFRPSFMDALGLGYDALREMNAEVIYASNNGFGAKGRWRDRGNFDIVVQGWSGAMVAQGGGPDNPPQTVRMSLGDQVGSLVFAFAIQSAIVARLRFGVGQRVDCSLVAAMLTVLNVNFVRFLRERYQETIPPDSRMIAGPGPSWNYYQTSDDKWLTLASTDPAEWPHLCRTIGRPDLIDDPRSDDPFHRVEHFDWLYEELQGTFRAQCRHYWIELLAEHKIACGPVNDLASAVADEQLWVNDSLVMQPHPRFGEIGVIGIPYSLSETPVSVGPPAPELGAHTEEVLLSCGYDWVYLVRFREHGVI